MARFASISRRQSPCMTIDPRTSKGSGSPR
jgi:hypothetical protein